MDDTDEFVSLVAGSLVSSELRSGMLYGLLLLGGDSGTDHFHHLLLEWRKASDFSDDLSDGLNSLGNSSLSGDGSSFPALLGRSVDLVSSAETHEDSSSVVGVTHVFYRL